LYEVCPGDNADESEEGQWPKNYRGNDSNEEKTDVCLSVEFCFK
jgi:hypothetical protein